MPAILLRLPGLISDSSHRPYQCPYCSGQILQRWGSVARNVDDTSKNEVEIFRYRCNGCKRTFRAYPKGHDQSRKTLRIRYLAALAWALGMSFREVSDFLRKHGIDLSHTTIWRDGKEILAQVNGIQKINPCKKYSLNKIFLNGVISKLGVMIAIDLGDGNTEILGTLDEHNPVQIKSWLESLVKDVGIEIVQLNTGELK